MKYDFSKEYIESFEFYIEKAQRLMTEAVPAPAEPVDPNAPKPAAPAPATNQAAPGILNGQLDLQHKAITLRFNIAGGSPKAFSFTDGKDGIDFKTFTLEQAFKMLQEKFQFTAPTTVNTGDLKKRLIDLIIAGDVIEFNVKNGVMD